MKAFIRSNVRWNKDIGDFELRCEECARKGQSRYWPLTLEFWSPTYGMLRCRACVLEHKRAREKARQTPDEKQRNAAYYAANRDLLRLKQKDWYRENRARRLDTQKAYYAKNKERINAERRESYAARKAA